MKSVQKVCQPILLKEPRMAASDFNGLISYILKSVLESVESESESETDIELLPSRPGLSVQKKPSNQMNERHLLRQNRETALHQQVEPAAQKRRKPLTATEGPDETGALNLLKEVSHRRNQ